MRLKDGVDGSGSHSIYHQINNVNTNNMIIYMFCLLDIVDQTKSAVLFTEKQSNSPNAMRPVFVIMGKESLSNLADVKIAFNQRIAIKEFVLKYRDYVYNIIIDAEMSCIDGKMRTLLSGLGGAFCLLCFVPLRVASGRDGDFSFYFDITRTAEDTMSVYKQLVCSDDKIKKQKGDYSTRGGLTQEPLILEDLNMVSPLHCKMRVFSFVLTLI